MSAATCSCGRRLIRVIGPGGLEVHSPVDVWRDDDGGVSLGPSMLRPEWRHTDNTPACEDPA